MMINIDKRRTTHHSVSPFQLPPNALHFQDEVRICLHHIITFAFQRVAGLAHVVLGLACDLFEFFLMYVVCAGELYRGELISYL